MMDYKQLRRIKTAVDNGLVMRGWKTRHWYTEFTGIAARENRHVELWLRYDAAPFVVEAYPHEHEWYVRVAVSRVPFTSVFVELGNEGYVYAESETFHDNDFLLIDRWAKHIISNWGYISWEHWLAGLVNTEAIHHD